jgi:hypothetical protein
MTCAPIRPQLQPPTTQCPELSSSRANFRALLTYAGSAQSGTARSLSRTDAHVRRTMGLSESLFLCFFTSSFCPEAGPISGMILTSRPSSHPHPPHYLPFSLVTLLASCHTTAQSSRSCAGRMTRATSSRIAVKGSTSTHSALLHTAIPRWRQHMAFAIVCVRFFAAHRLSPSSARSPMRSPPSPTRSRSCASAAGRRLPSTASTGR